MTNSIYIISNGAKDLSRWLEITYAGGSDVTLRLSELCQPGRLSSLRTVTCPAAILSQVLEGGGVFQVTTSGGYVLVRVESESMRIEFRGLDDKVLTRCEVSRAEVSESLAKQATESLATIK